MGNPEKKRPTGRLLRTRVGAAAAFVAAPLMLAACGGGESKAPNPDMRTPAATTTQGDYVLSGQGYELRQTRPDAIRITSTDPTGLDKTEFIEATAFLDRFGCDLKTDHPITETDKAKRHITSVTVFTSPADCFKKGAETYLRRTSPTGTPA